jgi:hypothetical protein
MMNRGKIIHNIRNPLNTIAMNAELGKLSLQKNADPTKLLAIFDIILRECRSCSEQLALLKDDAINSHSDLELQMGFIQTDTPQKNE